MISKVVSAILILISSAFSIGYQHGIFRSQSTQGATWLGTAAITEEKMNVTIYRNYLDVELDWVFKADGTAAPAEYGDALEIVGNINLVQGSVVVGMLVWYKDKVLKAKLKRKADARKDYEEVVDRNAIVPPRPRDPVMLEYLGRDNYDISIFPLKFQGTRHLRMRYLVPTTVMNGEITAVFPHAFTSTGIVTVKKSAEVYECLINSNNQNSEIFTDSITLTNVQAYYSQFSPSSISAKIIKDTLAAAKTSILVCNTNSSFLPGEFACVDNFAVNRILDSVKTYFSRLDANNVSGKVAVYASIGNGAVSCSTGVEISVASVANINSNVIWVKPLFVYSKTSVKHEIRWQAYFNGELIFKEIELPDYVESTNSQLESRLIAGSNKIISLEKSLPSSMAATFGFIDTAFALLALEEDSIPCHLKNFYKNSGVSLLNEEDIFADSADAVLMPATNLFQQQQQMLACLPNKKAELLKNLFAFFNCFVMNNKLVIQFDYSKYDGHTPFEAAIYSQNGRCIVKWNSRSIGNRSSIEWSPKEHGVAPGAYIVKVKMGNAQQAKAVSLF